MFRAIIFDMDGVLVNSEPLDFRVWVSLLARHGITVEHEELVSLIGKPTQQVLKYFEEKSGKILPPGILQEKRELFYELAGNELLPMPGVKDVLHELSQRDVQIAVASASEPKRIELALTKTGLKPYFHQIQSGEDVARNKPAPDLYLHAADSLGVDPKRCLVIEDSVPGIQAGVSAGMTVWGYTSSRPSSVLLSAGASRTFDSYQEILGDI